MEARVYVLPLAAVLGLAAGIGAGMWGGSPAASPLAAAEPVASGGTAKHGGSNSRDTATQAKVTLVKPGPLPKSTDTVESLLQLERGPLYARLGLWLLDASEEDMAAFWEGYYKREDPNDTIKDLLFTQWGKKNAAGMLAMARRTGCEVSAMWSWSLVDPEGMLAYVKGKDPRMSNYGLRGLAYFHPELARKMLEEDPSLANTFEMEQLAEMLSKGDPKAQLDFMAKYRDSDYYSRQGLKKWAAKDPHGAFEWLCDHGGEEYTRREFLETVKQEHPEVLPEFAAMLPDGAQRRMIESAAFAHLAETDPDKAAEEAAKIQVPRLAAERLAVLGKTLAETDPARAFEILDDLFAKCPDAATRMTWTRYPDGSSGGGNSGVAGLTEFLAALAGKAPEQTMQAMLDLEAQNPPQEGQPLYQPSGTASRQVAANWAATDFEGFTAWADAQATPALRDMGAGIASERLRNNGDFEGAVGWALRISNENEQRNALSGAVSYWSSRSHDEAEEWFENADLPETTRTSLQGYFPARHE